MPLLLDFSVSCMKTPDTFSCRLSFTLSTRLWKAKYEILLRHLISTLSTSVSENLQGLDRTDIFAKGKCDTEGCKGLTGVD
jgi:hypothetical protein